MSMTRAEIILKWSAYGVALTLAALVQFYLMGPILRTIIPLLIPMAVVALAVLEGAPAGAAFGMAAGAVQYALTHTTPLWVMALALGGWLVGLLAQYVLRRDFVGFVISALLTLVGLEALQVAPRLIAGVAGAAPLLLVAGREAFWTAALAAPVYWLFHLCCRRYGRIQYE